MPYDPQKHHRHSIRLRYDYTQPGAYFVTLCIRHSECLLGEIIKGVMHLSPFGCIVEKEWYRTTAVRRNVELDAFVIMPNHIHGIIVLTDTDSRGDPLRHPYPVKSDNSLGRPLTQLRATRQHLFTSPPNLIERVTPTGEMIRQVYPQGPASGSLGAIVGQIKSLSAKRINRIRHTLGVPVWQSNFYDHIIHRSASLHAIRQYIAENPLRWTDDPENPEYPVPAQHPLADFPF